MYASHPSTHQFSPQRRQILGGTNRRLSPKKANLGTEEGAGGVGPQKLFADLKQQTSAKKASTSASVFGGGKASARAFGEKTSNRSPHRPVAEHHHEDVPRKPHASDTSAAKGKQVSKQLVSPSKVVGKNPESIFLASTSPSKRKKRAAKDTSSEQSFVSSHTYDCHASPSKNAACLSPELQRLELNKAAFVTPEANVGQAGARRQRMGAMLDAMVEADASMMQGDASLHDDMHGQTEEEMYPEIEYMPPKPELPLELPESLDGMPRGREMGELLSRRPRMGFYKAKRAASIEAQRLEDLADVPDRLDGHIENLHVEPVRGVSEDDPWPNVEVAPREIMTVAQSSNSAAPPSKIMSSSSVKGSASRLPSASHISIASRGASSRSRVNANDERIAKSIPLKKQQDAAPLRPTARPLTKPTNGTTSRSQHAPPLAAKATTTKKPLLGEKNSNATVRRTTLNPALVDFDNDTMGKSIQAKLKALEPDPATEGFSL